LSNIRNLAVIGLAVASLLTPPAYSDDNEGHNGDRHVLLISIDGMHAVDYENCVAANTCPNLAALGNTGVNYTRTSASKPSDSFPGLMAIVTGGTPKLVGAYYDVAYDRVLAPPATGTGNGVAAGTCTPNTANGTRTEYEEGVDIDQSKLNGGGPYSTFDGGVLSIDPNKLPRDPFNACKPVYPWNFIRANTIYGVIHKAGGYTAWSDKHAVYAAVSGPTGTSVPSNVDDYYSPDINSKVINLPGVTTATGLDCTTAPKISAPDWTRDFDDVKCYDQLKVNAVLNWIKGRTHLGGSKAPVPVIFGMNFQAVSVGQKLLESGVNGGYTDAAGTPTAKMLGEIEFVDGAIGQFVSELKKQNVFDSTTIIITAKHGQSPIDTHRFVEIPTTSPAGLLSGTLPGYPTVYLPDSEINQIGPTEDDVSLLWLKPGASLLGAVGVIESAGTSAGLGQIFYGPSLQTMFGVPGVPPGGDPRVPDIIVQPNVGVIYSGSPNKQAEHGGFAHDDTNVMLLVSNPHIHSSTITTFVETTRVAPTILKVLGLDPNSLDAVQKEGTQVLPGLNFEE
jgi:hypothetical protein